MDRWTLSLHEAGHAVAFHVLSHGGTVTATLHEFGSAAWHGSDLMPTDSAMVTAAGPLAESLAERHTSPELPPTSVDRPPVVETLATAETAAGLRNDMRKALPDHVHIARFCISGVEGQPERWARRHVWIHLIAERLIRDHERSIVEAARVLYLRGIVSLPLTERTPH
ncbi:MAG TPA: hypothetical protein PK098_02120 [Phycisphaerales bacterium]|nr:hypothetical protein [Phycisphaerales bacterium]